MLRRILILALVLAACALPASAAAPPAPKSAVPKSLGIFGRWRAFVFSENGENVCYMALRARGAPLKLKKAVRGPVTLMITERPGDNSRDVVSYDTGYVFKPGSDLKIAIGRSGFSLFTEKDTAWSRDAMTDHALTAAILKNPSLTAMGTPAARGAGATTDTLALKGAPEAYRAITKACGIEIEAPPKPAKSQKKTKTGT